MKRASYRDAIAWIAESAVVGANTDERFSLPKLTESRFVAFCAHAFGISVDEVAVDVLAVRTKARGEQLRAAREAKKP